MRRLILPLLLFGIVGVTGELLLIGHFEDWQQWVPLGALALGGAATVVVWRRPVPAAQTAFRWIMLGGMWAIYACFGLVLFSTGALVQPIVQELDMDLSRMGAVLGSWPLVYIALAAPAGVTRVEVETAAEMHSAVMARAASSDLFVARSLLKRLPCLRPLGMRMRALWSFLSWRRCRHPIRLTCSRPFCGRTAENVPLTQARWFSC